MFHAFPSSLLLLSISFLSLLSSTSLPPYSLPPSLQSYFLPPSSPPPPSICPSLPPSLLPPHLCNRIMVSLSLSVSRVCEDSRCTTASQNSQICKYNSSSCCKICFLRFMARSNSSMTELSAGLAPAAHCRRWPIRNC